MYKLLNINYMIVVSGLLLLAGCGRVANPVAGFIPGTYVHAATGEYSVAEDTLVITVVNERAYRIERRAGFQPVRNGKLLTKRWKKQLFNGNYDADQQILFETTNGRVFSFEVAKGQLLVNGAVYRKL